MARDYRDPDYPPEYPDVPRPEPIPRKTVVVERRSNGGLVFLVALLIVACVGLYLYDRQGRSAPIDKATRHIANAAKDLGSAAHDVGTAVKNATSHAHPDQSPGQ